jgi:hypothetical protein
MFEVMFEVRFSGVDLRIDDIRYLKDKKKTLIYGGVQLVRGRGDL